jgi:hypothetical protein
MEEEDLPFHDSAKGVRAAHEDCSPDGLGFRSVTDQDARTVRCTNAAAGN